MLPSLVTRAILGPKSSCSKYLVNVCTIIFSMKICNCQKPAQITPNQLKPASTHKRNWFTGSKIKRHPKEVNHHCILYILKLLILAILRDQCSPFLVIQEAITIFNLSSVRETRLSSTINQRLPKQNPSFFSLLFFPNLSFILISWLLIHVS